MSFSSNAGRHSPQASVEVTARVVGLILLMVYSGRSLGQTDDPQIAQHEQAAAQGNVDAEIWLGDAYGAGKLVPRDYAQAFTWYKKAADQGNAAAETNVGYAYWAGRGIAQDYAQALGWYEKAAAQGYADAENGLGDLYWAGKGIAQDYAQALAWYRKAADQGENAAEDSLGNAYRNGWGVAQDLSQAAAWYQKAISDGYAQAKQNLADMQNQMVAAQATPAPPTQSDASVSASESVAEWQQEHQAKIDELTQEISNHEQQAQQDDADAEQAEVQEQQNANANVGNGPGSAFLRLGNAVQGTLSAGLAEKMHQEAANEREQAQDEREQLAELGAEQPPVLENNSEAMALTRLQTQMIQSGNTIQRAVNRELGGLLGGQQAAPPVLVANTAPQSQPVVSSGTITQAPSSAAAVIANAPPLMNGCVAVDSYHSPQSESTEGQWRFTNNCGTGINITIAAPPDPHFGGTMGNTAQPFLASGRAFIAPYSIQTYKYFACPRPWSPFDSASSPGHIVPASYDTMKAVCLQVDASGDILDASGNVVGH